MYRVLIYPRWSSIFGILSVELWIVLIISIVIAATSTTLVGRYSCTSEWQGYKTLTSSVTNILAVVLGVSVSTMSRAPSLISPFLSWVCLFLTFTTVFQALFATFHVDSSYKTPIQNFEVLHPRCVGSITKNIVYYTYSRTQLYFN
jgi:predicted neutral ceramidase superfamily lipid hydrolase